MTNVFMTNEMILIFTLILLISRFWMATFLLLLSYAINISELIRFARVSTPLAAFNVRRDFNY